MDQDETTPTAAEEPTDEPKPGKVIASYLVRVVLREPPPEPAAAAPDYRTYAPTNADVVAIVERALAEAFDGVPSVTSERLDI